MLVSQPADLPSVLRPSCSSPLARRELSAHVSAISKLLGADDYSYTLDLVLESLSPSSLPVDKLAIVVHLANLLLKSNPQCKLEIYP